VSFLIITESSGVLKGWFVWLVSGYGFSRIEAGGNDGGFSRPQHMKARILWRPCGTPEGVP
jgi:hypothetical protein